MSYSQIEIVANKDLKLREIDLAPAAESLSSNENLHPAVLFVGKVAHLLFVKYHSLEVLASQMRISDADMAAYGIEPNTQDSRLYVPICAEFRKIEKVSRNEITISNEVVVPESIVDSVSEKLDGQLFTIVTTKTGFSFPAKVLPSNKNEMRMSMSLRTLADCVVGDLVLLHKPTDSPLFTGEAKYEISKLARYRRKLDSWFENLLAARLGSPSIALRVVQGYPGDDGGAIARLHPSLFPMLGLLPGDHLIVEWGTRRAIVIAFEDDVDDAHHNRGHIKKTQGVGLKSADLPENFPEYLLIHLSAPARTLALGIPSSRPSTVVTVKRRIRTRLLSEISKILLPISVLIFGGSALPVSHGMKITITIILIIIFLLTALSPLKISRPPEGTWP